MHLRKASLMSPAPTPEVGLSCGCLLIIRAAASERGFVGLLTRRLGGSHSTSWLDGKRKRRLAGLLAADGGKQLTERANQSAGANLIDMLCQETKGIGFLLDVAERRRRNDVVGALSNQQATIRADGLPFVVVVTLI